MHLGGISSYRKNNARGEEQLVKMANDMANIEHKE